MAADSVQRPEDHHLGELTALHHEFESRAQGHRRLARPGAPAQADDADSRIEQQVQRHPLLGAASAHPERLQIGAHRLDAAIGQLASQGLAGG
ncbi:hypothetical protein SDC9_139384 [bioreactor metagenome]|uniref:Uncharacterized protein n=1 Tax=bioreactor metagenome TaxID=1076179 RepID=A0A645DSK0_9ZZZZ